MIRMNDGEPQPGMYRSDTRLYVNKDKSKLVPENSPEAAFVLCGEGGEIPLEVAAKYGLKPATVEPAVAPRSASPEDSAPSGEAAPDAENKAKRPQSDKAVKPVEDK